MSSTKLLYLEDFNLLESDANVAALSRENNRDIVVLDQTVFYPQGGGQPYDRGTIESPSAKFIVEEVRFADGIVKHIGKFEQDAFGANENVTLRVDPERRKLNSRIHSAGHVVDMAVTALNLGWIPGKGYHFPDGPYVEYAGSTSDTDREKLRLDIEQSCNTFIRERRKTTLRFMPKGEMHTVCHFVPDYIPEGKPARVVMYGDFGVPCGGTHVSNLSEIGSMTIRKIKPGGANIRVAYNISR